MYSWRKSKISLISLCVTMLLIMLSVFYIESQSRNERDEYDIQFKAAVLMDECLKAIKELRIEKNIPFDAFVDPNFTGMIGFEFTPLTTTPGDEAAKRTIINPNFAAMMVKYFVSLELEEGDHIAIGSSGSFPSLLLATLCAAKEMNLVPHIMYSFGASNYGATIENLTFFDMLEYLRDENLLPYYIEVVSMGGNNDQGENTSYDSIRNLLELFASPEETYLYSRDSKTVLRNLCEDAVEREGTIFVDISDLATNIEYRLDLFDELASGEQIKCFINIGGAEYSHGNISASNDLQNGIVKTYSPLPLSKERGLAFEYLNKGIPIINLLYVKGLCVDNGLPRDPIPLPLPGSGDIYYTGTYPKPLIIIAILMCFGVLVFFYIKESKNKKNLHVNYSGLIKDEDNKERYML